jgi:hypothetical protein
MGECPSPSGGTLEAPNDTTSSHLNSNMMLAVPFAALGPFLDIPCCFSAISHPTRASVYDTIRGLVEPPVASLESFEDFRS